MLYPKGSKQPVQVWASVMNVYKAPETTPPITPSPTPTSTQTPTPSITPTQTITPTNTGTPTQTPTNTPTQTQSGTPTQTPTQTNTPTPSSTPPASGTIEAQAYLSAVVAAGGTGITSTVSAATITMFNSIYSNGLNTGMIYMYPLLGGNAAGHKFNGLNPLDTDAAYRLVFNGGWTHSASGATPNGTNAWANTYFAPSSLASLTISGGTMGLYSGTDAAGNAAAGGGGSSPSNNYWAFYPKSATGIMSSLAWESNFGAATTTTIPDSLGGVHFTRSGTTTTVQYYRRGVLVESVNRDANAKATNFIYLGALNQNNSANQYSTYRHQFTYAHTGLTDSQITLLDGIIQTFQESLGRNVYSTGVPEANAYLSAVVAAGGTGITSTVSAATTTLFTSLVSNNLYDKIDIMYPLIGGTSASCKINAKLNATYDIVFNGGMTFNTSGMTGNAVNGYGTTQYLPFFTNNHVGYYLGTNTDNGYRSVSGIQTIAPGAEKLHNYINVGGDSQFRNGTTGASLTIPYNSSNWYYINTYEVGVGARVYSNGSLSGSIGGGAAVGSYTGTTGLGAPGLINTNGTISEYNGQRIQFLHSGIGLSAADASTLDTIINTFQTSLGRNKY
jgi:hypothetical protein